MKIHSLGLLGLLLAGGSGVAHSQTAWLLMSRSDHFAVVRAQGQTVRDIVPLRGPAPIYGESRGVVAVVASDEWIHVIDKESGMVRSFQLAIQPQYIGYPTEDLSGPLRNMLVTDDHAFFPTIRFGRGPLNELGGQHDIVQMSLADGSLRSIPLPEDCLHPQLTELGGVPVVYAWNGDRAWKLDAANGRVVSILTRDHVADLRAKEVAAPRSARGAPRAFIRYAMVSGAGVLRLSTLGELGKILDEDLAGVSAPATSVWLGTAHDVLALRSGTTRSRPAIGVVRQQEVQGLQQRRVTFSYLDASSLDVVWASDVAQGAIPESFYAADDGSVFYIDVITGDVIRLSQGEGSSASWHLPAGQSRSARILSIDLGR